MEKVQRGGDQCKKSKNQKVQNSKFGVFSQIQMHTLDTSVEEKIS